MILVAAWWWPPRESPELETQAYVWQRSDSPQLRAALARAPEVTGRLHFLGVEIGRRGGAWQVSRSTLPDEVFEGHGLVLRIGASLAGESWESGEALERVLAEAEWMAAKPAAEFQIDYDCPQRSLDGYRSLLEKIQARFPGTRWTITALPSWLDEPAARGLFAAADGVVLQVHSLQLPEDPARPVVLCDPGAARDAVRRMSRLGMPFHVALNTYGCEVYFDADGRVVDVVSEDVHSPPPPSATRRSMGISQAGELAGLVAGWNRDPPRGLRGIVWYRLPLESDRRNWRWVTWQRVAAGKSPVSDLRLEAHATANGAWDLVLENRGERDEPMPEIIDPGGETLVLEGLNGYTPEASERLFLESTAWPWLPPGSSITIGWLRPVEASTRPAPVIPASP